MVSTAVHTLSVFKHHIDAGATPGGQLCVSLGGKRMLDAAHGTIGPGMPAVTPDTIYDLASLTKVLSTTYWAARLSQEGRFDLTRFIAPGATFADALAHCAGFAAHRRFDQLAQGRDAIIQLVRKEPRAYEPRTQAIYSDLGFILLGAEIEKIAGPLNTLTTRDRFGVFYGSELRPDDVVAPTEVERVVHDENARAMGGVAGHAGLFGTANAVLSLGEQWLSAWRGTDESFLRRETVRRFWTRTDVPGSTRALGWDTPSLTGSSTGDVWPAHSYGHLGFTGTSLWIAPEVGLVVAMLTNRVILGRDRLENIKEMRRAVHAAVWRELTN